MAVQELSLSEPQVEQVPVLVLRCIRTPCPVVKARVCVGHLCLCRIREAVEV